MKINRSVILAVLVLAGVAYFVWDALSAPGTSDLPGHFRERAFSRNEQNSGPVLRVYSVSVKDTLWNQMEKYGNYMPYNKYGTTRVYFFLESGKVPAQVSVDGDQIGEEFKRDCIALYEKNTMSQVSLRKFPFRW